MYYGIGIIELDLEHIDSSSVIFPARNKNNLDWETMNKLCELNKDFNLCSKWSTSLVFR